MKYQPNDPVIVTQRGLSERAVVVAYDREAQAFLCQFCGDPAVQGLVEESEMSLVGEGRHP